MVKTITTSPPQALVLVSDVGQGDVPASTREDAIWATPTCVVVGCRSDIDGRTAVTLGRFADVRRAEAPTDERTLRTPQRRVVVRTVDGERLIEMSVPHALTAVVIWTNRPSAPDAIVIGLR